LEGEKEGVLDPEKRATTMKNRKTCVSRSFRRIMLVGLLNCFHSKLILKKNQAEGLRDPEWGCIFESFSFIKAIRRAA